MSKVKLRKGVCSYSTTIDGIDINATQERRTVEVEQSAAEYLVSTGYFEMVSQPVSVEEDEDEIDYDAEEDKKHPGAPETVDFDKMKKDELVAYAQKNGINIDGLSTKSEIKQAILDAINAGVPDIFTE